MKVENDTAEVANEEVPTPEVAGNETESTVSPNEDLVVLVKRFAPEMDTSTPELLNVAALKVLQELVPFYDKAMDLALTSTETAAFVNDLLETGDVPKSLARNYDPEELKALWEEITDDTYEDDRKMYSDKVSETKKRQELVSNNVDVSLQQINEFKEKNSGWSPEKAQAFEDFVIKHYNDANDGVISIKDLDLLAKGFTHEDDVVEAEENGKVMGRNEQIVAKKATQKDKENLLPELNGGTGTPAPDKEEDPFIAGLRKKVNTKPIL